jgi:hypothetical protein
MITVSYIWDHKLKEYIYVGRKRGYLFKLRHTSGSVINPQVTWYFTVQKCEAFFTSAAERGGRFKTPKEAQCAAEKWIVEKADKFLGKMES